MQDAMASEIIKHLQPAFYAIGAFSVLIFLTFGGLILKLMLDARKERSQKIDVSLDGLKSAVIETTKAINKLEVKMEFVIQKYDRDLNNLGNKVRQINPSS